MATPSLVNLSGWTIYPRVHDPFRPEPSAPYLDLGRLKFISGEDFRAYPHRDGVYHVIQQVLDGKLSGKDQQTEA